MHSAYSVWPEFNCTKDAAHQTGADFRRGRIVDDDHL